MDFIGMEIRQGFRTKSAPQHSKYGKEWKSLLVFAATTRVRMPSPWNVPCRLTRDTPNRVKINSGCLKDFARSRKIRLFETVIMAVQSDQ